MYATKVRTLETIETEQIENLREQIKDIQYKIKNSEA